MKRDLEQEMRAHGPDGMLRPAEARMQIKLLRAGAKVPSRATEHAAGWDVSACLGDDVQSIRGGGAVVELDRITSARTVKIGPGGWACIPLGFALAMPDGWEMQLRPRSGLAARNGVVGYFGTIDSDYRGECAMLLFAASSSMGLEVRHGDRIGQAIFARVPTIELVEVSELGESARGQGGFGSTGR